LKYIFKISKIALVIGAIFLFSANSWSQNDILELLPGAYKLSFNEKTGAQKLTGGGVNFTYQGNVMYCDSAYFYDKTNEVKAYGKVHINSNDTLNLFCDSMYYSGKTKKAKLWGNVRMRDREYKLLTDTLEYDAKLKQAVYRNGGRIESILNKEILTSKVGYFYPNTKNLFFSGKVNYRNDSLTMKTDTLRYKYLVKKVYFFGPTDIKSKTYSIHCEKGWFQTETEEGVLQKNANIIKGSKFISGDSLYVNAQKGISQGKGNIFYSDTVSKISFNGEKAYFSDLKKFGFLTGKAIAQYQLKKDTLFIHADTLFSYQDSLNELEKVLGHHDVRIFSRDFQGKCDSISFHQKNGKLEMFDKPMVWSKNAELKGQFMEVFLKDTIIERVEITDKSSAVMQLDSGKLYNQVAGKKMIAYFIENELKKLDVKGNAQTVYFPEETKENDSMIEIQRKGMTRLYASDLKIILDSGEVESVTYVGQPDGVMYPMDQINKDEQFIQYFSWNLKYRPLNVADLLKVIDEKKVNQEKSELEKAPLKSTK
jgi:lipopolysaccharide export system protein LptA